MRIGGDCRDAIHICQVTQVTAIGRLIDAEITCKWQEASGDDASGDVTLRGCVLKCAHRTSRSHTADLCTQCSSQIRLVARASLPALPGVRKSAYCCATVGDGAPVWHVGAISDGSCC